MRVGNIDHEDKLVLTKYSEDGEPRINIQRNQNILHQTMSVYNLPPQVKGIMSIVSKKIGMSNAAN